MYQYTNMIFIKSSFFLQSKFYYTKLRKLNINVMAEKIKIYIASDHAGFELKTKILNYLSNMIDFKDFGTYSSNSCNYNDFATIMLNEFEKNLPENQSQKCNIFGILICSSGVGMSMIANRFQKIRALLCQNKEQVIMARKHNNANVLCLGQNFTELEDAILYINTFINEEFEGGRHVQRLQFGDTKKYINLNYNGQVLKNYSKLEYDIKTFACGEIEFNLKENIPEQEITIFQTFTSGKFNDDIMKLLIVCDALKRNNIKKSITLFSPFLPYTRQDKTYDTKMSFGSKLLVDLINYSGVNNIITYDLHASQIEGFFTNKIQHLSMIPLFLQDIKNNINESDATIVFPDAGSAARFKNYTINYKFNIAIINKIRTENGLNMGLIGSVDGQNCIILDDMIDSGVTIVEAANLVKNNGAKKIQAYATHGIFSKNAIYNIEESVIDGIVISDSLSNNFPSDKFRIINIPHI